MAGTSDEAYAELQRWLRNNHFEWVADQIDEEVALGQREMKPVEVSTTTSAPYDPISQQPGRRTRGKKEKFLSIVPYSQEQKLDLMLDAIRTVIAGSVLMQQYILNVVAPSGGVEVRFVPGDRGEIKHRFQQSEISRPLEAARDLVAKIDIARKEVMKNK